MKSTWDAYWQHMQTTGYVNYIPELLSTICSLWDGLAGKRILEIGGGTGGNSSFVAGQGAEVHILDFSPIALQITYRTIQKDRTQAVLIQADAGSIPYADGIFDLVFHQGFLEHFHSPLPFLLEQKRVLKKGGYLLVDVPQKFSLYTIEKRLRMAFRRWEYGVWETEFSYRALHRLVVQAGFGVVCSYARGYYPWPFYAVRYFRKIEARLGDRHLLPKRWWDLYESWWAMFEKSPLSRLTLQCIGIVARKP